MEKTLKFEGVFESLLIYTKGYTERGNITRDSIAIYAQTIKELQAEILADITQAPEIIFAREKQAEINQYRLLISGADEPKRDAELLAVTHVKYSLIDSQPLAGGK